MRMKKWLYAIAAVFAVALVMFPLNLLWVGQPPLHAAVSSLLFGLPALLSAWTPKERRTGRRTESQGTAVCEKSRRCAESAGRIDYAAHAGPDAHAGSDVHAGSDAHAGSADRVGSARRKSLLSKAALGIGFFVLAAMLAYDVSTEGVAVGVTKAVGFVLLILVAAVGYRLGHLKL